MCSPDDGPRWTVASHFLMKSLDLMCHAYFLDIYIYIYMHMHIYIYIYICVCVCVMYVCVQYLH